MQVNAAKLTLFSGSANKARQLNKLGGVYSE